MKRRTRRIPRGVKKSDSRIYKPAISETDAQCKIHACEGRQERLNLLLRRAAYWNDTVTARKALEAGADPNSQNLLGEGPMISLCQKGSVEMLRLFLEHGAKLETDKFGVPPLIHAIRNFRTDLVGEMICAGADVNERENLVLNTPLHEAASRKGCVEIVKMLIQAGADPRATNIGGENVVERATGIQEEFGNLDKAVLDLLRKALRNWEGKPPPPKPRRKRKSKLHSIADKYINTEQGEARE